MKQSEDIFPKWVLYICILISFLIRGYQEYNYLAASGDHFVQFEMAYHLFEGRGISLSTVDPTDFSKEVFWKIMLWPPGYILLLTVLFGFIQDFVIAMVVLDILATFILWVVLYKTFQLLELKTCTQFFIFLFLGTSFSPLSHLYCTDLWSMVLFHLGVYFSLYLITHKNFKISNSILLSLIVFSITLVKYMFYVVVVFPVIFFLSNYLHFTKNYSKKVIRFSAYISICLGSLIFLFLLLSKQYTGSAVYLKKSDFQVYWSNLLWLDTFPFKTFYYSINFEQFFLINNLTQSLWAYAFQVVSYLLSVYIICIFCYYILILFKNQKVSQNTKPIKLYLLIFIMTFLLNTGYLAALSFLLPHQTGWTDFWTYVQETRYYAPTMLFMVILFMYFVLEHRINIILQRLNHLLLISMFLYAGLFMGYRSIGILFFHRDNYNIQYLYEELWAVNSMIQPYVNQQKTVFISDSERVLRYAKFTGASTISFQKSQKTSLQTSQAIQILFYTPQDANPQEIHFIQKYNAELVGEYSVYNLYLILLQPQ